MRIELARAGAEATGWAMDVGDEAAVARVTEAAIDRFGGLDVLVNCAGTSAVGPVESTSLETWRRVLDTNLTGSFLMSRAAIPHLRQRRGAMVTSPRSWPSPPSAGSRPTVRRRPRSSTSAAAWRSSSSGTACASTSCARARSTHRCYGPRSRTASARRARSTSSSAPIRSAASARPRRSPGPCAWLASDDASFAVGAALVVDGGYTLP